MSEAQSEHALVQSILTEAEPPAVLMRNGRRKPDMSKAAPPKPGKKKVNWRAPEDLDKCCVCRGLLDSKHRYWCKACSKAWRDNHYATHPEKRKPLVQSAIKWRSANPEKAAVYQARHRASEKIKATSKAWREANKEKVRHYDSQKNIVRKRAIGTDKIRYEDWKMVLNQYNYNCVYCGEHMEKPTRDHLIPLARGGKNVISNIVPSCKSCNSSKQAKTGPELEKWLMERDVPSEAMIMNDIMVAASERGHRLFRNNVGVARYGKSIVPYGLGVGSPDLIGWTRTGQFAAIEVKVRGKRPKPHQAAWMSAALVSCPGLRVGWANSVEGAISILEDKPEGGGLE